MPAPSSCRATNYRAWKKMKKINRIIKSLLFIFILFQISSFAAEPEKTGAHEKKKKKKRPEQQLENHQFDPDSSLTSRCRQAPDFIIKSIRKTNNKKPYKPYSLNKKEQEMIKQDIMKLPERFRKIMKDRLAGIYFVENFWARGIMANLRDEEKKMYSYFIVNPIVLEDNISDCITRKEYTCYILDDPDIRIRIDCGTNISGIFYVLIHEITHALDFMEKHTPHKKKSKKKKSMKAEIDGKDFTRRIRKELSKPFDKYDFPFHKKVSYYGMRDGPKINISDSAEVYKQLSGTPFASLYGSQNWMEDLTEFVTFYHLTQKLNHPYIIKVYNKYDLIFSYEPMKSKKIQERFKVIEKLYKK